MIHITGISAVTLLAVNRNISSCILIGDDGENLYICDYRHLENRAQASSCLKPKLDVTNLEISFANRTTTENWHYAIINGNSLNDAHIIACTLSRLVILRFDNVQNRFKPICALDTARPVSCILFTPHSAIVTSDKFFEIDLNRLTAEEFLDESDASAIISQSCKPMAIFKINSQEFLLCFEEYGLFMDDFGNRSRPDELNWTNLPSGFIYQKPLLFVSYSNIVEVIYINKSFGSNAEQQQQQLEQNDDVKNNVITTIPFRKPRIVGTVGDNGAFVLEAHSAYNDKLFSINGSKLLLQFHKCTSMEEVRSSMTSIPRSLTCSSETMSTINNISD